MGKSVSITVLMNVKLAIFMRLGIFFESYGPRGKALGLRAGGVHYISCTVVRVGTLRFRCLAYGPHWPGVSGQRIGHTRMLVCVAVQGVRWGVWRGVDGTMCTGACIHHLNYSRTYG